VALTRAGVAAGEEEASRRLRSRNACCSALRPPAEAAGTELRPCEAGQAHDGSGTQTASRFQWRRISMCIARGRAGRLQHSHHRAGRTTSQASAATVPAELHAAHPRGGRGGGAAGLTLALQEGQLLSRQAGRVDGDSRHAQALKATRNTQRGGFRGSSGALVVLGAPASAGASDFGD
jgi:hypothetical protein